MRITLTIENMERLPNGGQTTFDADGRTFSIGREHCDWVLPDPNLFVSGRHCDIRFENGGYWLYDVSRNGTFLNGNTDRMIAPARLKSGDRLRIGQYSVIVDIEVEPSATGRRVLPPDAFTPAASSPHLPNADPFSRTPPPPRMYAPRRRESAGDLDVFVASIARGAGVSSEVFGDRSPAEIAEDIGAVLRILVDELAELLKARASAKALAKSHQTVMGSIDNNPLKFVPGTEEIFEKMFGERRSGYLDARDSVRDAFDDLKRHEIATYAAMQSALARLLGDIAPETIEQKVQSSAFSSHKARAWDAFVATWDQLEQSHENGMLDAFLTYFGENYARTVKSR